MKRAVTFLSLTAITSILATSQPALADSYKKGEQAYQRQDYPEAVRLFSKSHNPKSYDRLGKLAEEGRVPNCDLDCAVRWYIKAADGGNLDSLPSIAIIYWNAQKQDIAIEVFNYAARWNEPLSREFLSQSGRPVPSPDLWNNHVEQQRLATIQAQEQQARNDQMFGALLLGAVTTWSAAQSGQAQGQQPAPISPTAKVAPLVSQSTNNSQRFCQYLTSTGYVTLTIGLMQMCPAKYAY